MIKQNINKCYWIGWLLYVYDADEETNVTEPEVFVIEDVKKAKKAYEVLVGDENTEDNQDASYL